MALIPQVDISVTLNDLGYKTPQFTEADTSEDLALFNVMFCDVGASGLTIGALIGGPRPAAFFPGYNSFGNPATPASVNLDLAANGITSHPTVTGGAPFNSQPCWNGQHVIILKIDNIAATGEIDAKIQAWPGTIDYTDSGLAPLAISNQARSAFTAIFPVTMTDASTGFCVAALDLNTFASRLLLIKNDLSTSGWFDDIPPAGFATVTRSWAGVNRFVDWTGLPTLAFYTVDFDFGAASSTFTLTGTGDVSTDAQNAFQPQPGTSGAYLTPHGIFGVDWNSGNNTGCWYCAYDASAFGKVSFVMPDASLGPSSDPSQWFNFQAANNPFAYGTQVCGWYPNFDDAGNWWWIRQPLQAAGVMILEPLTSEVYSSIALVAGAGKIFGSPVGTGGSGVILATK